MLPKNYDARRHVANRCYSASFNARLVTPHVVIRGVCAEVSSDKFQSHLKLKFWVIRLELMQLHKQTGKNYILYIAIYYILFPST